MPPGKDHGARRLEIRGSMVQKLSPLLAEKIRRSTHKTTSISPLEPSARFPLGTDAGQTRDAVRLTARLYNSHAQRSTTGAVSQVAKSVLLKIRGNCSCLRAKGAHLSGHLPQG